MSYLANVGWPVWDALFSQCGMPHLANVGCPIEPVWEACCSSPGAEAQLCCSCSVGQLLSGAAPIGGEKEDGEEGIPHWLNRAAL